MNVPIVLVHGAWHDGSCWDRIRPFLESAGHPVYTPTLPGLQEGYSGQAPTLAGQIGFLADYINEHGIAELLLVGHSWGGMVISGAAQRLAGQLRGLAYLDAAIPSDGDDFASQVPGQDSDALARRRATYRAMAADGVWIAPPPAAMVGVVKSEDVEWLEPRLRPHPLATWLEPVKIDAAVLQSLPKTYVLATDPASPMMGYPAHAARLSGSAGWTCVEIASGHDMMVTAARETADILVASAAG
ncbi:alpha/beta fold hydrolase [Sphingopyxis solisilvae]|uniref:alpha/beta fold hydrolase n=1 Tax=Sphingopyxis solisilvae TaxID=1886788 RepID=UPI001892B5FB|nr:alpha/beta hydrolase [Sphingopyxis solisilvae]